MSRKIIPNSVYLIAILIALAVIAGVILYQNDGLVVPTPTPTPTMNYSPL